MTVLLDYIDAWVAGDVTDRILAADREVAQLTFERTWKGSRTASTEQPLPASEAA
jgi:hypothetical protein